MHAPSTRRIAILGLYLYPAVAAAAEWHVTPDGAAEGDGSEASPWDLATAMAHPAAVMPGDTIWLHGGTYPIVGGLTGVLVGTLDQPIVMRAVAGERVTLDTGDSAENRIFIEGAYAWYWGFEVTSSAEDRYADDGNAADRGYSIDAGSSGNPGIKLINLVVHDTQGAIGFWSGLTDESEVYGCLIYFNGYDFEDRGHGHAIYTQNVEGAKIVRDNVMFGQYSHGIHAYTEGGQINDFVMEGNISFENGVVSTISGRTRNLLVGGAPVAENPQLRENYGWFDRGDGDGTSCDIGYGSGTADAIAEGNVCAGGIAFRVDGTPMSIAGNTFVGSVEGLDAGMFPDNDVYPDGAPSGAQSFVRPNAYDPDRAHVVVFNWDLADTVDVDLSALLADGDGFELYDVQNYYGDPVLAGTYAGPAAVPMTPGATAEVVGTPATPYVHTSAEFGAFVLVRTEAGPGGSDDGTGGDTGTVDDTGGVASADASDGSAGDDEGVSASVTASAGDSGEATSDDPGADDSGDGCGCASTPRSGLAWLALLGGVAGRRRSRARSPRE
ncbi:MAG TPA: hypothetical protein VFG69_09425 [Nannocystaceae bacterium]|nr:hypothetical protein [Nannocystaceae bacterium]